MEYKFRSGGLRRQMLIKAVMPMLLLTIVIAFVAYNGFSSAMEKEVKNELQYVCDIFYSQWEQEYPGDLVKEGTTEIRIFKGERLLNDQNQLLDKMKEICDIDITVFYNTLRVLTTITDAQGNRISGTGVNYRVEQDVLQQGTAAFYNNVTVNDMPYYGYYRPLFNTDGSCVGMIFAGKAAASVKKNILNSILPLMIVAVVGMLVAGFVTVKSSAKIVRRIESLQRSLKKVSDGKLDGGIDADILKVDDEISDIGRSVMYMQKALKELVELDALTRINNRRKGELRLKETIAKAEQYRTEFAVAIGDIDFFKKVNDTYGHDAGDMVLSQVATIMKNAMISHGYVARWGGEEFLLVFDRDDYLSCVRHLEAILEEVRGCKIKISEELEINVTMTFGITKGNYEEDLRYILNHADDLLYEGKEAGRNQVVADADMAEFQQIRMDLENIE